MKKILVVLLVIMGLVVTALAFYLFPRLQILNGHAAKVMCSCVFVAGIDEEVVRAEDIGFFPVSLGNQTVDYEQRKVTADFFGFKPKTAVYREGLGCAISSVNAPKDMGLTLGNIAFSTADYFDRNDSSLALVMTTVPDVESALDWAFSEEDPESPSKITRATLVVHKGRLIGERYAPGFDKDSQLLGWSMTKTITALLYGILERQGHLSLDDPMPVPEWRGTDKEALTIRHLLNMASGLEWQENYADRSGATIMLYESDAMGKMAAEAELTARPGEKWYYSSGTSNILATALASYFDDLEAYQRFPYEQLFGPLGMQSMVMETDAAGYFVGSSYSWATGRDWARLGLLMLNDGVFEGDTIVNPSWIEFMKTPVADSKGLYGGQTWLNAGQHMPNAPADAFSARGFHGQRVEVIPSEDLVIVRLGETYFEPNFDFDEWNTRVIDALRSPLTPVSKEANGN